MTLTTLLILLLSIGFFSCSYSIFRLQEKQKVFSDCEKLEQKQTEMRANHCLLVRRVDNIFKDEIFITREDFLEALKTISEDIEKMSGEIKQIDTYQKRQNRRLKVLELNDNHICKGNWDIEEDRRIFK